MSSERGSATRELKRVVERERCGRSTELWCLGKLQKIGALKLGPKTRIAKPLSACSPTPRPPRFCCLPPLTNHTLDASPYHPKACASAAAAAFFPLWRGSSLGFNKSIFILTNIPQAHDTHSTRTLSRDALLRFMTRFSLFSFHHHDTTIFYSPFALEPCLLSGLRRLRANPQIQYAYSHGMPISPPISFLLYRVLMLCQNYRNLSLVEGRPNLLIPNPKKLLAAPSSLRLLIFLDQTS